MSTTGTLPVLPVRDVGAAIDHYVKTLGFKEVMRVPGPSGELVTGQVERAGNHIMFNLNPADADRRGGGIWLWIRIDDDDIDAMCEGLRRAGRVIREEIGDRFWGDRSFSVEDAYGYVLAFNKRKKR